MKYSSKQESKIIWLILKNEQAKIFVKKVNKRVNWCMNSEINNVWEQVTKAIQIIVEH